MEPSIESGGEYGREETGKMHLLTEAMAKQAVKLRSGRGGATGVEDMLDSQVSSDSRDQFTLCRLSRYSALKLRRLKLPRPLTLIIYLSK